MIAELTIFPLGEGHHLSNSLAPILACVEESGLTYEVTPMGTLIEGAEDEVWALVRRCHRTMRALAQRVVTEVRIDDREAPPGLQLHQGGSGLLDPAFGTSALRYPRVGPA